jgi:hypothetical protein
VNNWKEEGTVAAGALKLGLWLELELELEEELGDGSESKGDK